MSRVSRPPYCDPLISERSWQVSYAQALIWLNNCLQSSQLSPTPKQAKPFVILFTFNGDLLAFVKDCILKKNQPFLSGLEGKER